VYYNSCVSAASVSGSRTSGAAAPKGFFGRLWRALKQLFHEMTATVFAILSLVMLSSTIRAWQAGGTHWILALPLAYALLMAYFSVTSFRNARRVP
jgi:hypothetical protein